MCAQEVLYGDCLVISADAIFYAELLESLMVAEGDIVCGNVHTSEGFCYSGCLKFTDTGIKKFRKLSKIRRRRL